jgi:hypothetical protein
MNLQVVAIALVLVVVGAAIWQHRRYLRIRRRIVGDRQSLIYPSRSFHAVTLVKVHPGKDVVAAVRALCTSIEVPAGGRVVYAGQVGATGVASAQVPNDWSGIVLAQYPSRQEFDRFRASDEFRAGLAHFEYAYTHGVVRPAGLNLALPLGLLLLRLADLLRRAPSAFPLVPAGADARPAQRAKVEELKQLAALRGLSESAIVIFNLIKPGTSEQRSADRSYTRRMMSGMAEGGYGPMHMGRPVTVEGDAEFGQFVAVYYPGIDFFQRLIGSTFMSRIGGDKQLGDSLAVITVPIPAG